MGDITSIPLEAIVMTLVYQLKLLIRLKKEIRDIFGFSVLVITLFIPFVSKCF